MKRVTRRLRIATSPVVLAVALGLLGSNVLGEEEDESSRSELPDGIRPDETPPSLTGGPALATEQR